MNGVGNPVGAGLMMLLVIVLCRDSPLAAEDSLHKGASTDILDVAQNGKMVDLFGLPAFFDAVVDKSDQTSRDNDAIQRNIC